MAVENRDPSPTSVRPPTDDSSPISSRFQMHTTGVGRPRFSQCSRLVPYAPPATVRQPPPRTLSRADFILFCRTPGIPGLRPRADTDSSPITCFYNIIHDPPVPKVHRLRKTKHNNIFIDLLRCFRRPVVQRLTSVSRSRFFFFQVRYQLSPVTISLPPIAR